MTSLYSSEYEQHEATETDDEDNEINFMIENEEDKSSEVVRPRMKKPQIMETSSEEEESDNGAENKIVDLKKKIFYPVCDE